MKILKLVKHPYPSPPEPRLEKEARTLPKARDGIFVLCTIQGNQQSEAVIEGKREIRFVFEPRKLPKRIFNVLLPEAPPADRF